MQSSEQPWGGVVAVAERYLARFRDPMTRALREEIAQESAVLAWQWIDKLQDVSCLDAAVRTIARRQRLRTLRARGRDGRDGRRRFVPLPGDDDSAAPVAPPAEQISLRIGARAVPSSWAVQRLDRALARLAPLDRRLLMGFHEGFCCAELAFRFGRSEACVKTRLHRARRSVQRHMEQLACAAGSFDEEGTEEG